jgi:hypothetical protein
VALTLLAGIGCTSARVGLGNPDAQLGGDADAPGIGVLGKDASFLPDASFALPDASIAPLDASIAPLDASFAPDAIVVLDAGASPDRVEIGSPCVNDCSCDFSLACISGTCQVANRLNMCCSNPFCPAGATCVELGCSGCCPITCIQAGASCGVIGDGCGEILHCGDCPAGETCGGATVPNQCGSPPDAGCVPVTCRLLNVNCGVVSDRCGGIIQCGTCMFPETCGGGGVPFVCGMAPPLTCAVDGGASD